MKRLLVLSCIALLLASTAFAAELTARIDGKKLLVEVDGKLFTAYCFDAAQKYPYFYPVNGPLSGESVTTETSEPYPHHHSLFFGCDRVNGGNYWQDKNETGQIFSRGPEILQAKGDKVVFRDRGDWKRTGAEQPIEDERVVTITAPAPDRRVIDFEITLTPRIDIKIEKTNHSLFSARMTPALSVKEGGTLVNASGDKAEAGTFGKSSPWCDYFGTRDGKTEGLAILQHPGNPWYPATWFTRDYGFFSPTPMYWPANDQFTELPKGKPVTLRYRVVVHAGDTAAANIAGVFAAWGGASEKKP
jgi:hypothetical protein